MPSRSKFPRAVENHFAEDIGDDAGARIGRAAESRMNFVVQRVEPGRIAEISQRPRINFVRRHEAQITSARSAIAAFASGVSRGDVIAAPKLCGGAHEGTRAAASL